MIKGLLPLVAVCLLSAGCATQSMKGTPFYSGEYEKREGPAADRIAIWPLLYYRDPALSVLWPIMEFSPSHQAVRPIYSAYDLDTDRPIYNVLWPFGRFDPEQQQNRFFPVYWGNDYFNVCPLYWHAGQPMSGTGHDALFPLWIWRKKDDGTSLHLAWPFYARHNYTTWNAWYLWPVYGTKQTPDSLSRYVAWPLVYTYTNSTRSGSSVIPLYAYSKDDSHTRLLSLPYSFSLAQKPGAKSWDTALPLWYRSWQGDHHSWMLFPALSGGQKGVDWADNWFALGLGRYAHTTDSLQHHLIPIYYSGTNQAERTFYTLPWWSKKRSEGSGFSALLPVYYRGYSDYYSSFYSLPWLMKKYSDGSGWHTTFPLYYRGYSDEASAFYSLPWFSKNYADGSGWHTTIPLYYARFSTNSSDFYSLVWMAEHHADGASWQASFPFYYSARTSDGSVMITPLYARKRHADGSAAWRCYIPLVYANEDYDTHFMTLLGGRWRLGDEQAWIALPLLSGGSKDAVSGRNIYLAGLAGQRWDDSGTSHYVFPFYYRAPQNNTLVSLPYSMWNDDDRHYRIIPPLLSGWYAEDEWSRGFMAAGLAGYRSGGLHPYHYLFPLYYTASQDERFYSLPYARWHKGSRKNHLILPLLSGWHTDEDSTGGTFALGLAGYRKGQPYSYNYLFPLYYAALENQSFLSLPYATWASGDRQHHTIPWLLSGWSTAPQSTDYLMLAGLGHWRQGVSGSEASHLLPFYMWAKGRYFYSALYGMDRKRTYYATPLAGRYQNDSGKAGSWLLPLYWHKYSPSSGSTKGYWFPLGYYNTTTNRTNHGFWGIYDYDQYTRYGSAVDEDGSQGQFERRRLRYLLSLGNSSESWSYAVDEEDESRTVTAYSKKQSFFPVWHHRINDRHAEGERLETSALLGILYDTRHETGRVGEQEHDYLRRRVLWRIYHYEKLNGDMSTDIFPGITVDSYKSGYYKLSLLWRLFRYEKDPENGEKKLDLFFLPLRR